MPHRAVTGSRNTDAVSVTFTPNEMRQNGVGGMSVLRAGRIVLLVTMALWSGVGYSAPKSLAPPDTVLKSSRTVLPDIDGPACGREGASGTLSGYVASG